MTRPNRAWAVIGLLAVAAMGAGTLAEDKKGATVTARATGSFEVNLSPLPLDNKDADKTLGRLAIDKTFTGGLTAGSKGEMLSAGTAVKGSAGYVAIERVEGTLDGRAGSFVLQHSGTLTRGEAALTVSVVPDSGTGQLVGLTGKMTIKVENKKHTYEFEYTLPKS